MLTPTSRVKALLAAFDNDSEEEEEEGDASTRPQSVHNGLQNTANYEVEFLDSDDEKIGISKPRNGTSPLNLNQDAKGSKPDDADETSGNDAYARLRHQLASKQPVRSDSASATDSDSDSLPDNAINPRFQALVAKKRAERQAKEHKAKEQEAKVAEEYKDVFTSEMDDGMDEEARKALTQRSRPSARKATKKAHEEMQRQIQRDLRNQQLAHEAKTKKRITTKDLFKRFNFMQDTVPEQTISCDAAKGTPPSSPPPLHAESPRTEKARNETSPLKLKKKIRVIPQPQPQAADDSDDDLEIIGAKNRFAVFDRTPTKNTSNAKSFLLLRALARVNSPSKAKPAGRNSLNPSELQARLQDRMRKQALAEKEEKLNDLKARGIIIQTDEERERDQLQVESMLERARNDAQALAKKEKDAANKDGKQGDGAKDVLSDDESEDEDWEEEPDNAEVELSGSEEEDGDDEAEDEESGEAETNVFVDGEASEDEDDEDDERNISDADIELADVPEDDEAHLPSKSRSKARARHVIADDEDDEEQDQPAPSAKLPQPSQDNALAAFGFNAPQSELGLTQMFKGTMDELQSQEDDGPNPESLPNSSLDFLRQLPAPTLPEFGIADTQPVLVENSQTEKLQTQDTEWPNVLQTPLKSLAMPSQFPFGSAMSPTKLSEVPEPTQDAGFEDFGAPAGTVDTVMMAATQSPAQPKKGKLRRRAKAVAVLSDDEDVHADAGSASEDDDFAPSKDAFDILFKAAKKTPSVATFDKKRSDAKNMVEEQAEESEDEYAGLGGASDDGSDGEMDEEMKKMIDEGPVDVDEAKLAKFYADRDRAEDEKRIDKLYKDITTGGLRRKRGADLDDLDEDSDDEAQERRRRKQREFARMRKALLEDENIGKIGE
jgi:mediator of replication checkpoint protein 1